MDQPSGEAGVSSDSQPGTIEGPSVLFDNSNFIPLDPTQEAIFPPALKVTLQQYNIVLIKRYRIGVLITVRDFVEG